MAYRMRFLAHGDGIYHADVKRRLNPAKQRVTGAPAQTALRQVETPVKNEIVDS
jgi:hypothetical protein